MNHRDCYPRPAFVLFEWHGRLSRATEDRRAFHRRGPWTRRATAGGFTLLELVVAMGMVAILAVSLYQSLRVAFNAKASAEAAVEPARTAGVAMEFLREDLQNIPPPGVGVNVLAGPLQGANATDDRGREADDVVFCTTAEGPRRADANGEIKRVELAVEAPAGATSHVLVRRVTRNLLADIQPAPDEEVLCRGVAGFTVQYFDGSQWQPSWDSAQHNNKLPAAVRVTIDLERPAGAGSRTIHFTRVFPLSCSNTIAGDTVQQTQGLNP